MLNVFYLLITINTQPFFYLILFIINNLSIRFKIIYFYFYSNAYNFLMCYPKGFIDDFYFFFGIGFFLKTILGQEICILVLTFHFALRIVYYFLPEILQNSQHKNIVRNAMQSILLSLQHILSAFFG